MIMSKSRFKCFIPQRKPLNWLFIFLITITSITITFSYFPSFNKEVIFKKTIILKENKIRW
jgi:hypothetical protein